MKEELISIVIPAYNIAPYISSALESVFAQTYSNFEVIAVDDGSTDHTGEILDSFASKEPRLRVIHTENRGASKARMTGVAAANGEIIGFMDGDDRIDPDMYERLHQNMIHHCANISHCGYRMVRKNHTELYYGTGVIIVQNHERGIKDLLEGAIVEPGLCNKLFRRSLFDCLLSGETIMDFSLRENEDLLTNYCLFQHCDRAVFEDVCPYQYMIRSDSSSHGGLKPHILSDPIRIGRLLINDTGDTPEFYQLAARYYVTKMIKAATVVVRKDTDRQIREIRKSARRELRSFLKPYCAVETSEKRKALACFAAVAPMIYSLVHRFYLQRSK
ncbi:MAG: glycosyltransferase family 2 protein [Clostridia bacterium]|nr:glycosyltransferase family 2 protein [Clostridia bacterium]